MPTFPLPSLKFRTAGFPQYGFKAGRSDRAFPFYASSRRTVCHCPSCSPLPSSDPRSVPGGRCALEHLRSSGRCRSTPRGLRSGPGCSVPFHPHLRPHPPHSQAHPDFTAQRLIRNALAVHTAPRRPPSGSTLSLSFLPNMPPSTTPGRSENRLVPVARSRHRPSPCYERLGSPDYPAIRFTQGRLFGASLVRFCCGLSSRSPPVQI